MKRTSKALGWSVSKTQLRPWRLRHRSYLHFKNSRISIPKKIYRLTKARLTKARLIQNPDCAPGLRKAGFEPLFSELSLRTLPARFFQASLCFSIIFRSCDPFFFFVFSCPLHTYFSRLRRLAASWAALCGGATAPRRQLCSGLRNRRV
jgi:hypothetical protein